MGTLRGRRDVRNTIFVPNPTGPVPTLSSAEDTLGPSPVPSPAARPATASTAQPQRTIPPATIHEDNTLSDSTSIHSSQTLHSLAGPISHPELRDPGLNASIVETVNAWFTEGAVTRSFVVGELALAYNAMDKTISDERIRLENFHILEKVAANPGFVTEAKNTSVKGKETAGDDDDRKGEYIVSLPAISRSIPLVAFKYQIHLDTSDLSTYCPVIFTPAWNIEEFQASVIINYALNPKYVSASSSSSSVSLRNVILTVNLDLSPEDEITKQPRQVARATGAVMYPNTDAAFRRKISAVTWRIPELNVSSEGNGRFLARFSTAVSWPRKGKIEAKFEARGDDGGSRLGISSQVSKSAGRENDMDPFADDEFGGATAALETAPTWKEVNTQRKLAAGRYISV